MYLTEVNTHKEQKDFLKAHIILNCSNSNWIRPLDQDIEQIFDPQRNRFFGYGKAKRWILRSDSGELIGRIAAFTNSKYRTKGDDLSVGGIGFFECVDQQEAADVLFNKAKDWLTDQGMEAMDGPINFGERDRWWGLLVEGFHPPIYGMPFNPPYYQELFEKYGFRNFYNQICWGLEIENREAQLMEKFYSGSKIYREDKDFSVRFIDKNDISTLAHDFCKVYNAAWAKHGENKEMSLESALRMFRKMKPVLDSHLLWFTYYKKEPIAIWLNIPDLNEIFKHFNGSLNWFRKIQFKYYQLKGICTRIVGILFGVIPEFQGKGIDYYMIVEVEKELKKIGRYKTLELMWMGDFNPKMMSISKSLGANISRRLVTYRYLFDRTRPFQRHPVIE